MAAHEDTLLVCGPVASLALQLAVWTRVLSIPHAERKAGYYQEQAPSLSKMQRILERENPQL